MNYDIDKVGYDIDEAQVTINQMSEEEITEALMKRKLYKVMEHLEERVSGILQTCDEGAEIKDIKGMLIPLINDIREQMEFFPLELTEDFNNRIKEKEAVKNGQSK